ncbi:MAG: hypothetical protein RIS45_771, partial [Planctomycetota bacterium]
MTSNRLIWTALASIALGSATNALADRRDDDGSDTPANNALWTERESYRPVGRAAQRPDVSRTNGEIKVNGTRGRSGGAALVSNWHTDWNDSFSMRFNVDLAAAGTTDARQRAVTGVTFGVAGPATVPLTLGYKTGVTVEIRSATDGLTIQLVARKGGRIVASSPRLDYIGGARDLEVSWVADPVARTVTVKLFDLAAPTLIPILELDGVEEVFSGRRGGIRNALLGYSTANYGFTSTFKSISHSGDDVGDDDSDDDDDDWCDDDDHSDDHGGSGGEGSFVSTAEFAAAWTVASAIDTDLLEAEAEDGGVEFICKEDAANVRVIRVSATTNTVTSNIVRPADLDELEKMTYLAGVSI